MQDTAYTLTDSFLGVLGVYSLFQTAQNELSTLLQLFEIKLLFTL